MCNKKSKTKDTPLRIYLTTRLSEDEVLVEELMKKRSGEMKIVYCSWFPFKGYKAITLLRWIVVRNDQRMRFTGADYNHECIHYEQEKELWFIGFYLLYIIDFALTMLYFWNWRKAYRNVAFEREAHDRQHDVQYLQHRQRFAWLKYDWE